MGEINGTETVTLSQNTLPSHVHPLNARTSPADRANPNGATLAVSKQPAYVAPTSTIAMNPQSTSATGGGQPHNNMQPFLAINFCIAMNGIFPSRS
jgi:microcystin-dependent protein